MVVLAVLSPCCVPRIAAQVSAECGTPWSGTIGAEEACQGFYVGSDAGFQTQCGDGFNRNGGCEVGVKFGFARHDADGDNAIDAQEAIGLFAAFGVDAEMMGATFANVDKDYDGKMTLAEWQAAGNIHPAVGMRVRTANGVDKSFRIESADFGTAFRDTLGTTYSLAVSVADPVTACSELQGATYQDTMVLARRGTCEFCQKAKQAQEKGAKAIMISNNDDSLLHMIPGTCGQDVTIPSIMITKSDGTELESLLSASAAQVYFPTCMDGGTVMAGYGLETCDDGNTNSDDGCSSKCIRECGNNVINGVETCDDGNANSTDGCSAQCSLEAGYIECSSAGCTTQCGDGVKVGEQDGCESAGMTIPFT